MSQHERRGSLNPTNAEGLKEFIPSLKKENSSTKELSPYEASLDNDGRLEWRKAIEDRINSLEQDSASLKQDNVSLKQKTNELEQDNASLKQKTNELKIRVILGSVISITLFIINRFYF